jgi:hypothetical protein
MVAVLLIAGIGFLLAGLVAIGFGIPVKEFSFGNTLILAGAAAACTGMIMLGLWTVVRELKNIARRLDPGLSAKSSAESTLLGAEAESDTQAPEGRGFLFSRDQPDKGRAEPAVPPATPWHEETTSRGRARFEAPAAPEPVEAAPALKPRRNLLFSSSSRKERERTQAPRKTEPSSAADLRPAEGGPLPPTHEPSGLPPPSFDHAWPKSERSRSADAPPPPRAGRAPSTSTEAGAAGADRHPPATQNEDRPPVAVLKSGVVDGMAYSLYSDGSIEAQMPEGMMRFASIEELRAHLDQRP